MKEQKQLIQQMLIENNTETDNCLELLLNIDEGREVSILIKEYDDPLRLAKGICFENNIDSKLISDLAQNIKDIQADNWGSIDKQNDHRCSNINTKFSDNQKKPWNKHFTSLNSQSRSKKLLTNESFFKEDSSNRIENSSSRVLKNLTKNSNSSFNESYCQNSRVTEKFNEPNVFDRLYSNKKYKMKQSRTSVQSANNSRVSEEKCLKIYEKNTKIKRQSLNRRKQLKQLQDLQTQSGLTFRPEINPISQVIARKLSQHNSSHFFSKKKMMLKSQDYILEKEQKELAECSFTPKILPISKQQKTTKDRLHLLYQDSFIRKNKSNLIKKQIQEHLTFQPQINKISQSVIGGRPFSQRLQEDKVIRKNHIKSNRSKNQPDFAPITGRAPSSRNLCSLPIGQYLYKKGTQQKAQKRQSQQKTKISKRTNQYYQENKQIAFRFLFSLLDSDEDGVISGSKANLLEIRPEILKIIMPLLMEMESLETQLTEQEFLEAIQNLFNSLNIADKNQILKVYKFNKEPEQPSFQPSLNQKSLIMAQQSKRNNMYEEWKAKHKQKEYLKQQLIALRQLEELEQCSFQPNLFPLY